MSRDDEDDDFTDEDDESDGDEVYDEGDDAGLTGDNNSAVEDTRMSESNKVNTENKPAPKAPPARRAPMGLLGTRPAAQAAKPQPSAKPTTQAAVPPPPVEPAAPPVTANLAKAELGFTEDMFAAFLKSEGAYQIADYAKIKFAGLVVMVQKWVAEAIETNVPPVDGWQAAVRKLEDTADAWLRDGKCDEQTAKKIKVLARFVSTRVEALSAFEEVKPAPTKKAELSVAPLANPPAKAEKVESKPAEPIAAKNPMKERACKPSNPPPPAKQITDPTAATEIGTPMPGPSHVTTGTGGSGGRTTITPEDQAKLAEVAAKITDEVSASIQAPPMSGLVTPVHPEAKAVVQRQLAELASTDPPAALPKFEPKAWSDTFRHGAPTYEARTYPSGEGEGSYPPAEAPAPAPAPAANPEPVKETKQSGITMKQFILMALVFMLGMVIYRFVVQDSPPVAPAVQAAAPTVTSAPAALAPSTTETCAKVTPALLQQHYGQGDPSAFRFEKKTGVRMDCKGKTIYKNPSTGLFNVQPCDICYSR
ncbi:MAG: hypothetical protein WC551_05245 [Patescibacteria group bacterium]